MMPTTPIADLHLRLATMPLLGLEGEVEPAGAIWRESPAVFVGLRHFGCVGCVAQVDALRPRLAEIAALGARVVLLGCGTVEGLRGAAQREGLGDAAGIAWRTDPTGAFQAAAGMHLSRWGSLGPRALAGLATVLAAGYAQPGGWFASDPQEGDRRQQGGLLVVGHGGPVVLAWASERLGDFAPLNAAVARCLALAAARAEVRL